MTPFLRSRAVKAALIGVAVTGFSTLARADIRDYEFQLVDQTIKAGPDRTIDVRLVNKTTGKPVPDAVIFAGPKAMLSADVPQEDLRRIGDIECPVFYMNYNLNPQAVPWKDSISHAIRAFKGTEYTISRPRDLWVSTSEMFSRIVRSKRQHAMAAAAAASTGTH